ncbi:hypothetical protein EVAR_89439_1 [Eumeta japonica]|uniref:Uncharacterized protein n=1 Tax=Eumeta variegata TaxID=151549 RepID=A0A4C1Z3G3_EUMVA|nr:hypothetical protein EVAR_89439_1 [Eumeta japonica]
MTVEEDDGVSTNNSSGSPVDSGNLKIWTPEMGSSPLNHRSCIPGEKTPGHEATNKSSGSYLRPKKKVMDDPRTNANADGAARKVLYRTNTSRTTATLLKYYVSKVSWSDKCLSGMSESTNPPANRNGLLELRARTATHNKTRRRPVVATQGKLKYYRFGRPGSRCTGTVVDLLERLHSFTFPAVK